MKKILLFTFLLLFSNQLFSQNSWSFVYQFTENLVGTVSFKDSLNGYATSLTSAPVVFKTTDAGLSWKKVSIGAIESSIFKFVHVNDVSIGIGGYQTLIKTTNNGESWAISNNISFVDICAAEGILFSGTSNGKLCISKDYGDSWQFLETPSTTMNSVAFFNKMEGICATNSESIIYTTDGGNSWTTVSVPASFVDMKIISETSAIGISDSRIFRTTDKGKSWSLVKYISNYINVDKIENAGNGTILISGGKALLKSTDYGANWGIQSFTGSISSISCINQDIFYLISGYTLYKTINGALTAPGLISPSNQTTDIPLSVNFQWESESVATSFNLQISQNINFTNIVLDTIVSKKNFQINKLELNRKYYWRVKDNLTGKTSLWSEVFTFTTTKGIPILMSPANQAIDVQNPVTFKYYDVSNNLDFYHIQISGKNDFSILIYDSVGVKANSIILSELSDSTLYYWRLRIKAGTQYSPWSDIWSFSTMAKTPRLEKPYNGSEISNKNITFLWSAADSASEYRIQISTDSTFKSVEIDSAYLNLTSINLTIKSNKKYYWRVCAQNKNNNIYWSNVWNFTINHEVNFPLDIGTKWYYDAMSYVCITNLTLPTIKVTKYYGTTKEVIFVLENGFRKIKVTNYYGDSTSTWVEYCGFIDGKLYIGGVPDTMLITNYYNTAVKNDTCWFDNYFCIIHKPLEFFGVADTAQEWQRNDGSVILHYRIMPGIGLVYNDSHIIPRGLGKTSIDTLWLIGILKDGVLNGDTLFSTVGVNEDILLPIDFELLQNYPNPFNPTTTIEYSIPSLTSVTLKVYDILGREVTTLVNEEKPAGKYQVTFDGSSLSSGVYFYRIEAGGYRETKKFALMK